MPPLELSTFVEAEFQVVGGDQGKLAALVMFIAVISFAIVVRIQACVIQAASCLIRSDLRQQSLEVSFGQSSRALRATDGPAR